MLQGEASSIKTGGLGRVVVELSTLEVHSSFDMEGCYCIHI